MDTTNLSIAQVKSKIKAIDIDQYPLWAQILRQDKRAGIQQLALSIEKKYQDYKDEKLRIDKLKEYELSLYQNSYTALAGMDEVGRGPLAGPVVSCAVILPKSSKILYINDSKKLVEKRREELCEKIKGEAISLGIGIVQREIIDEINIFNATKLSMKQAVEDLKTTPDILLIDAMNIQEIPIKQLSIIKGDEKCYSIAAASIVAKVTRDSIMEGYHEIYPQYNFKSNKGYGSKEHIEAIRKYGICPIHRVSFLNNILKVSYE